MALRVLLADESTSIKKVMQLALQDFGVEVKAVPAGVDVLSVAKSWNPDIIFVDVLLAKKSGYEVCAELKADAKLSQLPVVLIWSSFMEIDEKKASTCGAIHRLEKPFDADTLRGLVKELVPTTSGNAISDYLSFPHLPDFIENKPAPPPSLTSSPTLSDNNSSTFELEEFEEPEDFRQVPLPKVNPELSMPQSNASFSGLDRFKINIPEEDFSSLNDDIGVIDAPSIAAGNRREPPPSASLDPAVAEQILREQVRSVLQDIAWKIIPDIAERVVREEIQKLLKDAEKLS